MGTDQRQLILVLGAVVVGVSGLMVLATIAAVRRFDLTVSAVGAPRREPEFRRRFLALLRRLPSDAGGGYVARQRELLQALLDTYGAYARVAEELARGLVRNPRPPATPWTLPAPASLTGFDAELQSTYREFWQAYLTPAWQERLRAPAAAWAPQGDQPADAAPEVIRAGPLCLPYAAVRETLAGIAAYLREGQDATNDGGPRTPIYCPQCLETVEPERDTCQHCGAPLTFGPDADYVDRLIRALDHRAIEIATRAATFLGRVGDRRAVQPLLRAARQRPEMGLLGAVADALGELGDPAAIPLLTELVDSSWLPVRLHAVQALATIRPDGVLPASSEAALTRAAENDPSPAVREAARSALS